MTRCVPIRDMKDTSRFSRMVEDAGEPVTITKNGYDHLIVMTTDVFNDMNEQLAEAKLIAKIAQAESEIMSGKMVDGEEHMAAMREKYGY